MGLIKAGWRRSSNWSKKPPGACLLCHRETEHWSLKMAVRLICAFDCSFLSKEDLTFKRDLILSFVCCV